MKSELKKRYAQLKSEELLIVINSPDEYTSESVCTANTELLHRKVSLQNLLSSDNLSAVDLVRIGLKTDKKDNVGLIQKELRRRGVWESIYKHLQTDWLYSSQKILDESLPEGIMFNEKFEELISIDNSNKSDDAKVNIVILLFQYIANNMFNGETSDAIFLRLNEIGVNSDILLGLMEPFYLRIESSLVKQSPTAKSYLLATFVGVASAIIGGICYGYYMINTNSKLNYILILLGVFNGLTIDFVTKGKKGIAIVLIGIFSTVLAIIMGNGIYALYKNVAIPLTGFDLMWGLIGIAFILSVSSRIQIRKTKEQQGWKTNKTSKK